MAQSASFLRDLRILLVEDNYLVAEVVRDMLENCGCVVVGPVGRVESGLKLAQEEKLDGAVLDINLNGDRCFAIAETLRARGVPFMFLSGYDDLELIPAALRPTRRLGKPVMEQHLVSALSEMLAR